LQLSLKTSVKSLYLLSVRYNCYHNGVVFGCRQRAGLYAGWELVFRLPTTAAD